LNLIIGKIHYEPDKKENSVNFKKNNNKKSSGEAEASKGSVSNTGYTGKYFRYDQFLSESNQEENAKKEKKKKKSNKV
jgi:hypothetical protein